MRRRNSHLLIPVAVLLSLALSGCFGPYIHTPDHFHGDDYQGHWGHYRPPCP